MTAPNTQTTQLTKFWGDFNQDAIMSSMPAPIAGVAGNQTIAANSGIIGGLLSHTPTANVTLTLDTAANFVTQIFGSGPAVNTAANQGAYFDFTIVNLGSTANTADTLAAGTGGTTSGNMTISLSTSASFRVLFTSNAAYTVYRK